MQGQQLQDFIIDKIDDLKGQQITALNVQGKSSITDYMVICTGTSNRHVISVAEYVAKEAKLAGVEPMGIEGTQTGDWVIVDLGDVIVHVMQEESRAAYQLERLWG
ncbi:MAG: ribosome silencing factor [Plesiomonas sp.]|uniref:ribosome silencing factor n=1 Tax=Plesiomonas sp. TaxID=2486279 RepID=UPI003EE4D59E